MLAVIYSPHGNGGFWVGPWGMPYSPRELLENNPHHGFRSIVDIETFSKAYRVELKKFTPGEWADVAPITFHWRCLGNRCGLRTGTMCLDKGEHWGHMRRFLQDSDPGAQVAVYSVNKDGDEIFREELCLNE